MVAASDADRVTLRLASAALQSPNSHIMYGFLYGNITPVEVEMVSEPQHRTKLGWILEAGWKGLCPRCGEGHMFKAWLKVSDTCEVCGLDYGFAAPDDGPAFFSLCIVAFPLTFFIVWLQVAYSPPLWVHFVTSAPLMAIGCVLPLRPIKGWLVASQYVNKAHEAGTAQLWGLLNGRTVEKGKTAFDD